MVDDEPGRADPDDGATPSGARPHAGRERTRARLLGAAREVFVAHGFDRGQVEEIAARAGVSVGSIYVHFGSKQNLFLTLLSEQLEQSVHGAGPAVHDGFAPMIDDVTARLTAEADDAELAALDAECRVAAVRHPAFRDELAHHELRALERTTSLVADAPWRRGAARTISDAEAAVVFMSLRDGLLWRRRLVPDAVAPDLFGRVLGVLSEAFGRSAPPD